MDDPTLLSWIEKGQNIATLLVAVGVAAEFALGFIAGPARRRVDETNHEEILRLTNGSAVLEKEAAQLRKDAEQLKAENLKLEASVTWRRLSDEQQKALSAVLLPYAEMIGIAQYNVGDSEAGGFASDIAESLGAAHWKVTDPVEIIKDSQAQPGPLPLGTNPPPKTGVVVRTANDKRSEEAGRIFAEELNKFGFDCIQLKHEQVSISYLNILVLHRPDGPQGEFKLKAGSSLPESAAS